jgi:DNA-binding Lrp family transcriptional regulator
MSDLINPCCPTPKKNPRGNVQNTLARGAEKTQLALEWIASFHFTVLPILALRLGIHENTAWRFVKKLKAKGFIRGVDVFVIRHELLLLTQTGLQYGEELTERIFHYTTEPSKINTNRVRHDLNVQMAVLSRLREGDSFLPERLLKWGDRRKVPDALVESRQQKWALEIELTSKSDDRIYIGFESHIKALHDGLYDQVEYIFKTKTLMDYYLRRFRSDVWPVYSWNDQQKRRLQVPQQKYCPKEDRDIINKIKFTVETMYSG